MTSDTHTFQLYTDATSMHPPLLFQHSVLLAAGNEGVQHVGAGGGRACLPSFRPAGANDAPDNDPMTFTTTSGLVLNPAIRIPVE